MNPFVTVDLTTYEDIGEHFQKVWEAELLMINTNRSTIRVRVIDQGSPVSFDCPMQYIVEDKFDVIVRENLSC